MLNPLKMDLEKRVDRLEIAVNELIVNSQKQTAMLEELHRFAKIQLAYSERMETHMHRLEIRMDKLETRMDKLETRMDHLEKDVKELKQEVKGIINYLQNPPKNGH